MEEDWKVGDLLKDESTFLILVLLVFGCCGLCCVICVGLYCMQHNRAAIDSRMVEQQVMIHSQ